jgi:hypothetical protein
MLLAPGPALAHRVGESYVFVQVWPDRLEGRWEATLAELDQAIGLDRDGDARVSAEELTAGRDALVAYFHAHFLLRDPVPAAEAECGMPRLLESELGQYSLLSFRLDVPRAQRLDLEYTAFFADRPQHRGLLVVEYDDATGKRNETEETALVFRADRTRQVLDLTATPPMRRFATFVGEGIHHIWIGADHVLFLLALILPSVVRRRSGRWEPLPDFRSGLVELVKVATVFTVAHSVTLTLAALGWVKLDSRLVESIIAASVVVAALAHGLHGRRLWPVVFLFGLFHGFGFATVLGHLTVNPSFLVPALLGFNVGVELGQVTILAVAFPLLYMARRWSAYPAVVLHGGSGVIAAIALVWFVERAFQLTILGF